MLKIQSDSWKEKRLKDKIWDVSIYGFLLLIGTIFFIWIIYSIILVIIDLFRGKITFNMNNPQLETIFTFIVRGFFSIVAILKGFLTNIYFWIFIGAWLVIKWGMAVYNLLKNIDYKLERFYDWYGGEERVFDEEENVFWDALDQRSNKNDKKKKNR